MSNTIHKFLLQLNHFSHWPDTVEYQHDTRFWAIETTLQLAQLSKVSTVCEIGCGDGWMSCQLAERFPRVVGLDINSDRIHRPTRAGVLLMAASAERLPIAEHSMDLIVSLDVMEHLANRVEVLRRLKTLLSPHGKMIHIIPASGWKLLQWAGFIPDELRKHVRGLTRALAGKRRNRRAKYRSEFETNNPYRRSRRGTWYRKLVPRVHGEYDNHLDEWLGWSKRAWMRQFDEAGLEVEQCIPLGLHSPYGFGLKKLARNLYSTVFVSERGWVLKPADD